MAFPNPTSQYHHTPTAAIDPTKDQILAVGKIVLVTGGGTAIGAATVEAFAQAKAKDSFLIGRRGNLLKDVESKVDPSPQLQ